METTAEPEPERPEGPVLLCFDGSEHAGQAIAMAGRVLAQTRAVILTVKEPLEVWAPYDPSPFSAMIATIGSRRLGLDELADELAQDTLDHGLACARRAGFEARGRIVHGKAWRAICNAAEELDASVVVLGARGRSRVQSALLGSVSAAVSVHAPCPVLIGH